MNVTILADASHCPQTLAGGYAFWIASQRGKLAGSGPLKGRIANSTVAEMMALANAFHQSIMKGLVHPYDTVLFQTDCIAAIDAFEVTRSLTLDEKVVVEYLHNIANRADIVVKFKHVKGHTKRGNGARFAANRKCDEQARAAMRKQRGRIICENSLQLLRGKNETDAR